MRDDIKKIVGKQIKGVVVTEGESDPRSQVFLIFSDETYYEFYSPCAISWTSYAYRGGLEEVKNYMPHQGIIVEVCDDTLGRKVPGERCGICLTGYGIHGAECHSRVI